MTITFPFLINLLGNYETYDMITDNVAIGDYMSSYKNFDIIINLNYPTNNAPYHGGYVTEENNKIIYSIGIVDTEEENMKSFFSVFIPKMKELTKKLMKEKENPKIYSKIYPNIYPKILFHCSDGVSRSATLAIAYLAKTLHKSVNDMFDLVKIKRNCIHPNRGFVKHLIRFDNWRIVDDIIDNIAIERETVHN